MNHNGFTINFDGMEEVLAQFRVTTQEIRNSIDFLITKADAQSASWDGATFESYQAAKIEWDAGANELDRKMNAISAAAQRCQTEMGETEAANLQIAKSLM